MELTVVDKITFHFFPSFLRSSFAVLGLGPIEKLNLLKEKPTTIVSGLGSLL